MLSNGSKGRQVYCRRTKSVSELVENIREELKNDGEWVTFHQKKNRTFTKMSIWQQLRMLKKYKIVVDGAAHSVTFTELRRTYTRLMYKDGVCIRDIDKNLGGKGKVEKLLGFVGPLEQHKTLEKSSPTPREL